MFQMPRLRLQPNRPRRSRSRWRKTLDRRYERAHPGSRILTVNRRTLVMTVQHPDSEEGRRRAREDTQALMLLGVGIGVLGMPKALRALEMALGPEGCPAGAAGEIGVPGGP